jgi:hypothetical protein
MTRKRKITANILVVVAAIIIAVMWWAFSATRVRVPSSPVYVIWYVATAVALIICVVGFRDRPLYTLAIAVLLRLYTANRSFLSSLLAIRQPGKL